IGPATAFLYAGPAINVLAIVFTAQVLGYDIGLARAISAVTLSVLIGLIMSRLFKDHDKKVDEDNRKNGMHLQSTPSERSSKITLLFFALMVAILVIGASGLDWVPKLAIVYLLTLAVAYLLIYHFKKDEVTDWGYETWDLTKKIFPILIAGTFIVGVIAFFLPHATFAPYLGGNSIGSNLFGAIIGAILYMPTLLEVVIIDGTFGFSTGGIGAGPALALLLSGPAVSLPNMIVLQRIMGTKKTVAYIALVVLMSTIAGFTYGMIVS
ncbi:MAG: permease, partial [Candidatus Thermoplasmatota archaeon]|nr:permease [Candidatus Thermoplasmatota archaeon]